ncbi:MAG: XdhC family protein [Opitutaceae bacterium]
MRSLWPQLATWLDSGEPFALATVTRVSGSAPRAPGACMAIQPATQRFLGSVSSGCLEMEVFAAAEKTLASGVPEFLRFGPDGIAPWSDGLTCGGWIEVRIEPWWGFSPRSEIRAVATPVREWLERGSEGVTLSRDDRHLAISVGGEEAGDAQAFETAWRKRALAHLVHGLPPVAVEEEGGASVFMRTVRRRPRLVLVGAVDIATHLVALARETGWETTVIDPRAAYATAERFPTAPDRLVRSWPQKVIADIGLGPRDAAIALTHDSKIDDAALLALLKTRAGHLGALGSARSHADRRERLLAAGAAQEAIERIQGPAGIHLGTPDAAGIAAGILAGLLQWQAAAERERLEQASVPSVATA